MLILLLLGTLVAQPMASATGLVYTLSVTSTCGGLIDGSHSTSASVSSSETSNVTVENNDTIVSQSVSGPNIPAGSVLGPDSKTGPSNIATYQLGTVTSQETISFTPIPNSTNPFPNGNNCPTGSTPVASQLIITPVAPAPTPSPSTSKTNTQSASTNSTAAPATATTTQAPTISLTGVQVNGKSINTSGQIIVSSGQELKLSGQTISNGLVTLTIHSVQPKTVSTTADSNGDWSYTISTSSLASGSHYVQASVEDPASKQSSSQITILSFKINPTMSRTHVVTVAKKSSATRDVIYGLIALVVVALIALALWKRDKFLKTSRKEDTSTTEAKTDNTETTSAPEDDKTTEANKKDS